MATCVSANTSEIAIDMITGIDFFTSISHSAADFAEVTWFSSQHTFNPCQNKILVSLLAAIL